VADYHEPHWVAMAEDGTYVFKGKNYVEYLKTASDKNEQIFGFIHSGATAEDVIKLQHLKKGEFFKVAGVIEKPSSAKDFDRQIEKVAEELDTEVYALDTNYPKLLKTAAYFREKGSVDAILGLGMLRKNSVREHLALLPTYESVMGELAKLLVAARLGLQGVDPGVVKDAMDEMAKVVIMLRSMAGYIK